MPIAGRGSGYVNYWLDPFSGETWELFQASGARVTGFRDGHWQRARSIEPGDMLLCYLLRVKRWVGLLEVTEARFRGNASDFPGERLPVRLGVKPIVALKPVHGVPMELLKDRLSFYTSGHKPNHWVAHVRRSLARYQQSDGDAIAQALHEAAANPTERPVDPKKLMRSPTLYKVAARADDQAIEAVVSIPTRDEENEPNNTGCGQPPTHTEIQWRLLDLGGQIGLDVWAPRADRNKTWLEGRIADLPKLLDRLPTLFNLSLPALKTIENIDVLWLEEGSIIAAFEVEHTTTIYSGLLRMSDLVTMSRLVGVKLYLVAPDRRFATFMREIARPTFASRGTPLHTLCRFLPYSTLCQRLEEGKDLVRFLRPEFLDDLAESYDPSEELDI